MEFEISDSGLRRQLGRAGSVPVTEHADAIGSLPSRGYSHSIECLSSAQERITCLMQAFEFGSEGEYADIAKTGIFAGSRFVRWLLYRQHLRPANDVTSGPRLILYFRGQDWTHAGVVDGDRAVSKWGTFGIFRHPIDEVPIEYGDRVVIYENPEPDEALRLFKQYAAECQRLPGWAIQG